MDRFLRSLLTSLVGDSVDTDKSISEIARSVLSGSPGGDPKSLRERAGLLALLNLLGIVEAFYGEMPLSVGASVPPQESCDAAVSSLLEATTTSTTATTAPAVPAPSAGTAPGPISLVSGLTKMLGTMQTPAADGSPTQGIPSISSILAGIDPSLIAGLLSMIASMAKPRLARPVPVEAESSPETPSESGTETAEAAVESEAAPPSPLQQLLGIDPKVLTLALNVLAELMKTKQAEAKERPADPAAAADDTSARAPQKEARPSQASFPAGRKTGRAHRPGLGIYRSPLSAPKPEPHSERQT